MKLLLKILKKVLITGTQRSIGIKFTKLANSNFFKTYYTIKIEERKIKLSKPQIYLRSRILHTKHSQGIQPLISLHHHFKTQTMVLSYHILSAQKNHTIKKNHDQLKTRSHKTKIKNQSPPTSPTAYAITDNLEHELNVLEKEFEVNKQQLHDDFVVSYNLKKRA